MRSSISSTLLHFTSILCSIHVSIGNDVPECATRVITCPENEMSWGQKEIQKACRTSEEIYTCMMFQNEYLVEMCLVDFIISNGTGGCPSIIGCLDGKPVPAGKNSLCSEERKGCPPKFHGGFPVSKLYQYPACLKRPRYETKETSSKTTTFSAVLISTTHADLRNDDGAFAGFLLAFPALFIAIIISIAVICFIRRKKRKRRNHLSITYASDNEGDAAPLIETTEIVIMPLLSEEIGSGEKRKIITTKIEVLNKIESLPENCCPFFIYYCDDAEIDTMEERKAAYAIVSSRRPYTDVSKIISKSHIPEEKFLEEGTMLKWMREKETKLYEENGMLADSQRTLNNSEERALLRDRERRGKIDDFVVRNPPSFLLGLDPLIIAVIYDNETEFNNSLLHSSSMNDKTLKKTLKQIYQLKIKSENIEGEIVRRIFELAESEYPDRALSLRYNVKERAYVILEFSDKILTPIIDTYCGLKFETRNQMIPLETKKTETPKNKDNDSIPKKASSEQLMKAKKCIKKNSRELWSSYSNLIAITSEITGSSTYDFKIILVCKGKGLRPIDDKEFPKHVKFNENVKILTSVREGNFYFAGVVGNPTGFNERLCMGCSIGSNMKDVEKNGTLGLFLDVQGSLKCITTYHSLYEKIHSGQNLIEVIQPGPGDLHCQHEPYDRIIGKVDKCVFCTANTSEDEIGVDAVLVNVEKRNPRQGLFAFRDIQQLKNAGYNDGTFPKYNKGKYVDDITKTEQPRTVVKSGTASGFTKGYVHIDGIEVRVNPKDPVFGTDEELRIMKGQYEIKEENNPFCQEGDSGAAVFLEDSTGDLLCIGIVIGRIRTLRHGCSTIVTPISAVLNKLGLTFTNIRKFDENIKQE